MIVKRETPIRLVYQPIQLFSCYRYCITGYLEYFLRYKQYETTTDDYFITGVFVERYPVDSSIWGSPGVNEWCHQNGRVAIKLLNGDLEHLKAIRLYFYNDDDYNCRHGYIIKICANDRSPSGVPEHPLVEVPF